MVFFTCNACGESLKKGQVDKHVSVCRSCQSLSCIDCGKDFWGDDYKNHVKCITEDQKYGGKGYEAKSNKGDVKQQQWIQKIHEAMNKPGISPKLREVLQQVSSYDNVPRKKGKFQNWMKNSLKLNNQALQDQVWDIFSTATSSEPSQPQKCTNSQPDESEEKNQASVTEEKAPSKEKKKNKRERKEERQKKNKKEKKTLRLESQEEAEDDDQVPMHEAKGENGTENGHGLEDVTTSKKCKKRKHDNLEENPKSKQMKVEMDDDDDVDDAEGERENKGKFNWKGTIKSILKQSPEEGISIKKLRKKVLAAYYTVSGEDNHKTEEALFSLFNKKIHCNPKFRVLKEKVKLVQ
ncbi:cell growth-regulating nucleolar protein [Amia ocellicauda]|uniref:cell growth-regulating nucleolar protein n=1 Tax=Amia ocellicauda TaxID=2972642 RepID=UPI003463AD19